MCELFYWIFFKFLTTWNAVIITSFSAGSVLVCQLKHGLGQIKTAELFHTIKAVWVSSTLCCTRYIKCFIRKCNYSWPWSEESLVGYIGEIVATIIIFNTIMAIVVQLFLLFISICFNLFTFNDMFASFVNELDNATEKEKKIEAFRKLIEFHMCIKECV